MHCGGVAWVRLLYARPLRPHAAPPALLCSLGRPMVRAAHIAYLCTASTDQGERAVGESFPSSLCACAMSTLRIFSG